MRPDRRAQVTASLLAISAATSGSCDRQGLSTSASEGAPGASQVTDSPSIAAPSSPKSAPLPADAPSGTAALPTIDSPPPKDEVTLIAGGDVCLGRSIGQELLKDPGFDPFESARAILKTADLRFVNMESQLSDQKGETQSPTMKLKFTGPPAGADALARAGIDVVSAANNHMWDYGKAAFLQTLDNLDRAKVAYAGAGRTREQAYLPVVLTAGGRKIAFVAFTGIWNQGDLAFHEAKDHVARATREAVISGVTAARATPGVDFVIVSYHGGEEYVSVPLQLAIDLHHAAIDAGADAVLGHHPHVTQGIEVYHGKPIFYSLGNFLMRTHRSFAETEIGHLARVTFRAHGAPLTWICPYRIAGIVPHALFLAQDPRRDVYERVFRQRVRVIQGSIVAPAKIGSTEEDGCAKVSAP